MAKFKPIFEKMIRLEGGLDGGSQHMGNAFFN
jgi:hypothetical protein